MAEGISARLTPREARRFGLVVGAAFLVLGALVWWRGRPVTIQVFWALGAALILFGIILPRALVPVHRAWMGLALAISKVTTPVFLGAVYFVVITPIGLLRRMFGKDALKPKQIGESCWVPRSSGPEPSDMTHQF
jgi:saxitoxin biosynthesis operon SxtJ-like protein